MLKELLSNLKWCLKKSYATASRGILRKKIVPQTDWIAMHLALITFGRNNLPAKYKDLDPYPFLDNKKP